MDEIEGENKFADRDAALEEIATRLGARAQRGRRFADLTSLRVGGAIDWVLSPETEDQAAAIVNEMDKAGIGWRPLGSGSNILADDGDHHYVVLSLKELKGELVFDGERVSVPAGYSLPRLCVDVARHGLSGIEGLGGIPGTVEGALGTGKIIDEMGMKGSRRGSAVISPVHANFIVTEGEGARAEDALALAEEVRERVKREHGIDLEYEVELWRANAPKKKPEADEPADESNRKEST